MTSITCNTCVQGLYNKLYVQLSTDMHTALNKLIAEAASKSDKLSSSGKADSAMGKSKGAEGPSRHHLAVLKGLADEAELTGDQAAADTYHQERVLAPANAQVRCMLEPHAHHLVSLSLHMPRLFLLLEAIRLQLAEGCAFALLALM